MKSKYLIDPTTFELPAFDVQITQYVEEKGEDPWGSKKLLHRHLS